MGVIWSYGDTLVDDLVEVRRHTFEPVMDGSTYLYTRHLWHLTGVLNPDSASFGVGTPATVGTPPYARSPRATSAPQRLGVESLAAIRHQLNQPRQRLLIQVDDAGAPGGRFTWFVAPQGGAVCDASNGPTPIAVHIPEVVGSGVHVPIEIVIEACVNECLGTADLRFPGAFGVVPAVVRPSGGPPLVLSHLWEPEDDMADNFLTTRTVRGHCILRADAARLAGARPDDFRRVLFHLVPSNCQRRNIQARQSEDGNRLDYSFVDAERMENLTAVVQAACPGIVDLEASHTASIGKPSEDELVIALGHSLARGLGRVTRGLAGGLMSGFAGVVTGVLASAIDLGVTAVGLVPRKVHTVVCRAIGSRQAERKKLEGVALRFCLARLNAVSTTFVDRGAAHLSVEYGWQAGHKFAQVTIRAKEGIRNLFADMQARFFRRLRAAVTADGASADLSPTTLLAAAGDALRFTRLVTDIMPGVEPTDFLSTSRFVTAPNPSPPGENGTRGTFLEILAAQALQEPCAFPTAPRVGTFTTDAAKVLVDRFRDTRPPG